MNRGIGRGWKSATTSTPSSSMFRESVKTLRSRFNFLLEFSVEVRTPLAKRPRQNPSNPKT